MRPNLSPNFRIPRVNALRPSTTILPFATMSGLLEIAAFKEAKLYSNRPATNASARS
ncbi:hypothetical protein [Acinetobacter phage Ab1656-2]|nr:hypothetical protein [Acinetobacter phage Ab1656-2]